MKKRCSPAGMVNAIGFTVLSILIAVPVEWIIIADLVENRPRTRDDMAAYIACIVITVLFFIMIAGASLIIALRLRRAFGFVELSESRVEEHSRNKTDCMSWDDIGWIFVLPELSYNYRIGAMLEKRICFAKEKRELTIAERLNILIAEDVISFPYSIDAEKYVRHQTDTAIDFHYVEDNRTIADIAQEERAKRKSHAKSGK